MIELALMIEGQNGLNWGRWQKIAQAAEALGFVGLYRSDHYTNSNPPDLDSLELWVSLTWLASHTKKLEFGPLVTPASFRHPSMTARMAAAVDDLSGGRLTLGLGAGWQEREHNKFGLDLLPVPERFLRFKESLDVISGLLDDEVPFSYQGKFYKLQDAILLPRPIRRSGPPILIGGNGKLRTLPLVAEFAKEWNALYIPAEKFRILNEHLDALLEERGRHPLEVRRSLMTGLYFGATDEAVATKLASRKRSFEDMRKLGVIVGTPSQVVDQLGELADAGVARVMLQWLDLDDLDGLVKLAETVLPQLS